jgi:hypothetical protein
VFFILAHIEWHGIQWLTSAEFEQHFKISTTTRWRMMRSGRLLPAHHYVRTNTGTRSALRFNLTACEMALIYQTQR